MTLNVSKVENKENVETKSNDNLITDLSEQVKTLQENVSNLTSEKESLSTQIETLKTSLSDKDSEIISLQEKIKEIEKEAKVEKDNHRKEQIKELVSIDDLDSVMSIVDLLNDEQFGVYVSTLQSKQDKTRKEMEEIGGDGADVSELSVSEKIAAKAKQL